MLHDVTEESLAQRVRREFVSHASHELKSPVAGLQTLAEAVQTAVQTDDRDAAQRFAEKLRNESDRLGRLVGDLLDLSRLEDTGEATPEPVHLAKVARRELEQVRSQSTAKSMTLEDRIDAELARVEPGAPVAAHWFADRQVGPQLLESPPLFSHPRLQRHGTVGVSSGSANTRSSGVAVQRQARSLSNAPLNPPVLTSAQARHGARMATTIVARRGVEVDPNIVEAVENIPETLRVFLGGYELSPLGYLLLVNVIDVESGVAVSPPVPTEEDHLVLHELREGYDTISTKSVRGRWWRRVRTASHSPWTAPTPAATTPSAV